MKISSGLRLPRFAGAVSASICVLTIASATADQPAFLGTALQESGVEQVSLAQGSSDNSLWLSLAFAIDDYKNGVLDPPPDEPKQVAPTEPLTPEEEIAALQAQVSALQAELEDAEQAKASLTYRLSLWTMNDIAAAEDVIARTGLDTDLMLLRLAESQGETERGSGYLPVSATIDPAADDASLLALSSHVERWDGLRQLLLQLPLSEPLDEFRNTSQFGVRVDPIHGRHAFHAGLDFAAPMGSTIRATAPGVVVKAGVNGGYGRMVEIDHGLGIHTRYAHLSAILVEEGDVIGYRDPIGRLGNSGRSTGPHLHYEVHLDGEQVDPAPFIDAGRYVFKAQY